MMIITKQRGLAGLFLLAVASIFFSLQYGSTLIEFNQLTETLLGQGNPLLQDIIFQLRLPRTLSAFVTGGLLALAGAMMQVLLRNPLADPYILGISGGGAVITLILMACGFSGYWLTGGAWFGSLGAIALVFIFTKNHFHWQPQRILLTGVALSSGFSAIISFILALSTDKELHSMMFWLLGDLSFATHLPLLESVVLISALLYSCKMAEELNILTRGEREAQALGIHTAHLQMKLYFISALLTATAVSLAGCIGFIGLIIPHLFRLLGGYDHRFLLPGSALLGGSLLTIADTLSRSVLTPVQLPVGIIITFIGVPMFIFLLNREQQK